MKRLLAYLFIVLGFGLILNINANAETIVKLYFKDQYPPCLEGETPWDTSCGKLSSSSPISFKQWKSKKKNFNKNGLCISPKYGQVRYFEHIENCDYWENTYSQKYYKLINLKGNTFKIDGYEGKVAFQNFTDSKELEKTQIAKAEPSQTQEVAKLQNKITKCPDRPEELGATMGMEAMFNSCYVMKELWSKDDTIKIFGDSKNSTNPNGYEYFWGHIKKKSNKEDTYTFIGKAMQRNGSTCEIKIHRPHTRGSLVLKKYNYQLEFETKCGDFSKNLNKVSYASDKDIFVVDGQNIFISDDAGKLRNFVEKRLGEVLDTREKIFAAQLDKYIDSIKKKGEKPLYDQAKSAKENWEVLSSQLDRILRAEYKKKKEKKKIAKKPKEEFKPKKTNQDNEAPIIEIAEVMTVNDSDYEFEGKVTDQAKTIYIEIDGRPTDVKNGKFIVKGYSPIDKQISIEAIDQWGNRSEPKIVKLKIDIKDTIVAEKLEPLNPSKIRSKSSNNKVALIIGIENYLESPSAKYANLDAKYFFDYARKGFGVKKQNINLLVDEEATFVKTNKALTKWLRSKIKADQSDLIIFFAGHGLASSDGKELYLLPQDSDPDLLSRTALSRTELFQEIINLNPKSVTMFLDTCYSGVSRDEKMLLASARPIRIIANEEEGIPNNFTIFSASQLDQISSGLKEAKHGIFSYYLMKGLEGKADSNNDKKITNGELLAYMDENISQKASELGRQQNPSLAGDPDKILMSYK